MSRKKRSMPVHFAKDARDRVIRIPIREERPGYFRVDYRVAGAGKGHRKCFSDLTSAENHARSLQVEKVNHGLAAFSLTGEQRQDALTALKLLSGSSSLTKAAEEYILRHPVRDAEKLVTTAARYIRQMRREGARRISIKDKIWKFRVFLKGVGKETVTASVEPADIERWMDLRGYNARSTRKSYRAAVGCLLNFYHGKRKIREHRDEVLPTIWKAPQIERLMRAAEEHRPDIAPALAILFFAGLRPHELFRLDWHSVDLKERIITVTAESSKVRSARTVGMSNNLRRWLASHPRKNGLVCGGVFVYRHRREAVMKKAGLTDWPKDVARHSFATAHYWHHQDASLTMKELGHFGNSQTFVRHYKSLMTPLEAEAYWKIAPNKNGQHQARSRSTS